MKPGGRRLRLKKRSSASQRRHAPVVDAPSQILKWQRLEETLHRKKHEGRSVNLDEKAVLKKAKKSRSANAKEYIAESKILHQVIRGAEMPPPEKNMKKARALSVKERARLATMEFLSEHNK